MFSSLIPSKYEILFSITIFGIDRLLFHFILLNTSLNELIRPTFKAYPTSFLAYQLKSSSPHLSHNPIKSDSRLMTGAHLHQSPPSSSDTTSPPPPSPAGPPTVPVTVCLGPPAAPQQLGGPSSGGSADGVRGPVLSTGAPGSPAGSQPAGSAYTLCEGLRFTY